MSQRLKRMNKKLLSLSENYEREAEVNKLIEIYSKVLEELNDEVDDLWMEYDAIMGYIYKEDDASISYDLLELPNGELINVIILETADQIAVSYNGLIGKAKKHKHDDFNYETGYNLAATRLMMKIMENKYM